VATTTMAMAMTMGVCVSSILKFSSYNYNNKTVTVAVQKKEKMAVPYNLKKGQSRIFHKLPSGLNMEVIVQKKKEGKYKCC
ncbi:alpha/beta-hydrolases superfamily protein, partial [Trifolium medium]|nr:alpha/beta-hydrolases superfamily protein [Trifolium medium]